MVDIPEDDDLKAPNEEMNIDASELQMGSGIFWCEKFADSLVFTAEIIEFDDLIQITKQLEYYDTMLHKLNIINESTLTYEEVIEERKRKNYDNEEDNKDNDDIDDKDNKESKEKKQDVKQVDEDDEDDDGEKVDTVVEIETEDLRQMRRWREFLLQINDVDKELKDIPGDASNAFCITLFFTHQMIDNLS